MVTNPLFVLNTIPTPTAELSSSQVIKFGFHRFAVNFLILMLFLLLIYLVVNYHIMPIVSILTLPKILNKFHGTLDKTSTVISSNVTRNYRLINPCWSFNLIVGITLCSATRTSESSCIPIMPAFLAVTIH